MNNLIKKILFFKVAKFKINYSRFNPKKWKKLSFKKVIRGLAFLIIFLGAFIIVKDEYEYQFGVGYWSTDEEYSDEEILDESNMDEDICNVSGIELHGDLVTYIVPENENTEGLSLIDETASEYIIYALNEAESDDAIKAVILEVDSYGGTPVAAEEVNKALHKVTKPVVVMVRSAANSAAYWSAVGGDIIFASPSSDIGSIGVTMSYLDNSAKNNEDGLTYNSLSTGKFKDYTNPNKELTEEERALLMRDINIVNENFIKTVANDRNLDINKVRALADGASMPAQMALDNGLIDRIGGIYEVEEYLMDKIGAEVNTCW
jgi:signal peptide peptidase SppA